MFKLIIGGALGRMGREVALAADMEGIEIVCGVDVAYSGQPSAFPIVTGYDQLSAQADVLIDFSRADALPELLNTVQKNKLPAVLCTTGYTDVELNRIAETSKHVALLRSANMSLGINVLQQLVAMATKALGEGFDIEIVEKHHQMKLDSPSGTALLLYEAAKKERGSEAEPIFGRYGRTEKRAPNEIGLHAVRGGTVTGEHEVGFYGKGEQIILTHRAESRALFAAGALKAAIFLCDKSAGMYSMQDVVREMLN